MGDDNNTEAAKKSGISSSNFTRWKKGARADPDFVVKVARAYGVNVLEALVEAEFITEEEAKLRKVQVGGVTLKEATNKQILDEILRRSDPEAAYLFGDPTGEAIDYQPQNAEIPKLPHLQAVADSSTEEGHDYPDDFEP